MYARVWSSYLLSLQVYCYDSLGVIVKVYLLKPRIRDFDLFVCQHPQHSLHFLQNLSWQVFASMFRLQAFPTWSICVWTVTWSLTAACPLNPPTACAWPQISYLNKDLPQIYALSMTPSPLRWHRSVQRLLDSNDVISVMSSSSYSFISGINPELGTFEIQYMAIQAINNFATYLMQSKHAIKRLDSSNIVQEFGIFGSRYDVWSQCSNEHEGMQNTNKCKN